MSLENIVEPSEKEKEFAKIFYAEMFPETKEHHHLFDMVRGLKRMVPLMSPEIQILFKGTYFYQSKRKVSVENRLKSSVHSYCRDYNDTNLDPLTFCGFTISELKTNIESKFKPWMSWENWGEWQIDHVIPRNKYRETKDRSIFGLENLHPVSKEFNLRKGKKCPQ